MTPLHPHRRVITIAAIALAVTAITAPAASARFDLGPQQQSSAPQTQTGPVAPPVLQPVKHSQLAAIERAKLQALAYVPPNGPYNSAELNAQAGGLLSAASSHSPGGPGSSGPTLRAGPSGSGFDWSDAAILAAIAVAVVLLITAGTRAIRQQRQPRHP